MCVCTCGACVHMLEWVGTCLLCVHEFPWITLGPGLHTSHKVRVPQGHLVQRLLYWLRKQVGLLVSYAC